MRIVPAPRRARALALVLLLAACGDAAPPATPSAPVAPPPAVPAETPAAPAVPTVPAPAPAVPAVAPEVLSDAWYEVLNDGRKTAWYHMVWTRSSFEGKPSIHDRTENVSVSTRVMDGMEDEFRSRSVTDLERTEDGRLLAMRVESWIEDRVETSEVRWTGKGYVRTSRVAGLEEIREIVCAEPVPVDAEAYLAPIAQRGELAVGKEYAFPSLDFEGGQRLRTVRLEVVGVEDVEAAGEGVRCFRVKETVEDQPGTTIWWLDSRGVLCRLLQGPVRVRRATRREATRLDAAAAAYEITFEADPPIARSTSFDRCVVDVTVGARDGVDPPEFPATPFSRVLSRQGTTWRMELTAHDAPDATTSLPVKDPSVAKWLESSNLYSPQHPRIQEELKSAIGDERDARKVARALLRHVFTLLRKGSGPVPQPTAVEIVESGMGDCSEHAVLFVSLCRAAGLPARRLSGYAQVGDVWGAHSFCEVWLGKWVGADPTTNELGTKARYLAFGWDEDPDSFPGLVSASVSGHMRIRTLEFEEGGKRMTVADASKEQDLRDDLSGLAVASPPEGWEVHATPGFGVSVSGPGVAAQAQCLWGMGDLDADLLRGTVVPGAARETLFCGEVALRTDTGRYRANRVTWIVPWRRRVISIHARLEPGAAEAMKTLERLFAPTFAK